MSESDVPRSGSAPDFSTLVVGADPPGIADVADADRQIVAAFGDAERWLDAAYGADAGGPDTVLCAGEVLRSASTTETTGDAGVTVSAVPDIGSLGQMAAEIRSAVGEARSGGRSVGVLITGFDAAIEATSLEAGFRFLHVLTAYLRAGPGDTRLYVYTGGSLSPEATEALRPLFGTLEDRGS
jgi:hypothetical protein